MSLASRTEWRRWAIVASASLAMAAGFGGMTTVSVLIAPLEGELGVLRSEVSMAYTLITLGVALGGLMMGGLPIRPVVTGGAFAIGVAFLLIAQQRTIGSIQAIYLAAGLVGFSCLYGPPLTAASLWFRERAGVALGLVTAGGSIGQAVVPPLFQALTDGLGWRMACVVLGLSYCLVVAPALVLVRNPPEPRAGGITAHAAGTWPLPPIVSVALLALAAMFCCLLMATPMVHLIPLVIGNGLDAREASAMMGVMMVAGCVGRVAAGALADRMGALATYALVSALQTATVCLFVTPGSGWTLTLSVAAFGLSFGGVMTGLVCTIRAAAPPRVLGRAMSVVGLMAWLGMGAGGYQAGLCFDITGRYKASFLIAAGAGVANLAILGGLALWLARAKARRFPGLASA